ncbi:MAG: YheC/YheD family protein [Clostridia bacterium]|nr:YheC/YheD family protein [Clostridia bacterium]
MIDLTKLDRDNLEFVEEYTQIFAACEEDLFEYNGIDFGIDYKDGKIWVYEDKENGRNFLFNTPEDFFEVFLLDGEEFLQKLDEIATN